MTTCMDKVMTKFEDTKANIDVLRNELVAYLYDYIVNKNTKSWLDANLIQKKIESCELIMNNIRSLQQKALVQDKEEEENAVKEVAVDYWEEQFQNCIEKLQGLTSHVELEAYKQEFRKVAVESSNRQEAEALLDQKRIALGGLDG